MSNPVVGIKKWARLNDNIAEYLRKGFTANQLIDAFLSTEALARTICALDGLDYAIIYSADFDRNSFEEIKERLTAALYPHVLAVKRDLQSKLLAKSVEEDMRPIPQIEDFEHEPLLSEPWQYQKGEGILEQIEKHVFPERNFLASKPYPADTSGIRNLYMGKSVVTEEQIDKWVEGRNLGTNPQPYIQPPVNEEAMSFEKMKGTMQATRNVGDEVKKETDFDYAADYNAQRKYGIHIHSSQPKAKSAEQMFPILAIGDLHAPFIKDGYLDFCKQLVKTYKVQSTVFLGDIVDNHRLSRFPKSTKSDIWRTERIKAKRQLADWHTAFPDAYVMIGNHDERFANRMHELELDDDVIPSLNELYDLPTWKFKRSLNVGDVYYFTHGTGKGHGKIRENVLRRNISYVVGHFHNKFGQEYVTQDKSIIYCGCGVDTESYAFDYHAADDKNSITGAMIIYPSFVIPVPMFCKKMNNTVLSNEKY